MKTTTLKILESPSAQKQFDRCRLLWQLQYVEYWEPREASKSLPARLRGTAFAKGTEIIHRAIMEDVREQLDNPEFITLATEEAVNLFTKQYTYCVEKGIVFADNVLVTSQAELRRVIPLYAHHTPVRQWQQVLGVEHVIPEYSCRIDLAGINSLGFHTVADIKYKSSLESTYEANNIEEFHWSPQFQQYPYVWRLDQQLDASIPVYSTLLLVVGSRFRIKPVEWLYTDEQVALWHASATDLTDAIQQVKAGVALPRASTTHRDGFGWCAMKRACLDYHLDPELMKQAYVQLDQFPE